MSYTQQPTNGHGSFQQRAINVTLSLGKGTFGQSGANRVTLQGHRVSVAIAKGGAPSMDTAEVRIYGVQPSISNAVTTLGVPFTMVRHDNGIIVEAGDPAFGMSIAFNGYLAQCWNDYSGAPETALQIVSRGGLFEAVNPVQPISFPGGADVATIMASIATVAGWEFENNGVQVQLASPYFAGTAWQQAQKCAQAAGIQWCLDTGTTPATLAIWPKTATRGGIVPLISKDTGLIGYPRHSDLGMSFTCLFNPNIRVGGTIKMQSTVGSSAAYSNPNAPSPETALSGGPNGYWYVASVTHDLAAQMPEAPWFTECNCTRTKVT